MTNLLAQALEAVSRLAPEDQDEIARAMLRLAQGDGDPEQIPAEHLAAVLDGLAQADAGQFASDAEVVVHFAVSSHQAPAYAAGNPGYCRDRCLYPGAKPFGRVARPRCHSGLP